MSDRRKAGEIRLLEKQLRPEVIERCLQFLDVVIHQIVHRERLYPSVLFVPRQMFRRQVFHCVEKEISAYISQCVSSVRDLLTEQSVDVIAVNLLSDGRVPAILRRYLLELHPVDDPCLRAIYDNTRELLGQLDEIFARALQAIEQIQPLENDNLTWALQFRISAAGRKKSSERDFPLVNGESQLVGECRISSIRSFHCERLDLQVMCSDDLYEQSHCPDNTPCPTNVSLDPPLDSSNDSSSSSDDSTLPAIFEETDDEEDEF